MLLALDKMKEMVTEETTEKLAEENEKCEETVEKGPGGQKRQLSVRL